MTSAFYSVKMFLSNKRVLFSLTIDLSGLKTKLESQIYELKRTAKIVIKQSEDAVTKYMEGQNHAYKPKTRRRRA